MQISLKEDDMVQAYCMKCRTKKEMKNSKAITMKNGKPATQGTCPSCGTKMFRIGKAWNLFQKNKKAEHLADTQPFLFEIAITGLLLGTL